MFDLFEDDIVESILARDDPSAAAGFSQANIIANRNAIHILCVLLEKKESTETRELELIRYS